MSLRVEWVGYGRAAADALRVAIRAAKGDDPLAAVTVVVASNHVGVATRRLLASGRLGPVCSRGTGLASVTFLTAYRLAEFLGAPRLAEAGRRPVSTPVIAAALRAELDEGGGLFSSVAKHPATEAALVQAYRELRDLSEPALSVLERASPRASEVVRLHRGARRRLQPAWYDEEDLMTAAAGAIGAVATLGAVIVYLPQRISLHATRLFAEVEVRVIAGTTGDARADAGVLESLRRLGSSESPTVGFRSVTGTGRTRIITTSDADEEVREAIRAVLEAAREGTPLDRIALLYASPAPYARIVYEQLGAAGIPSNGSSVIPLRDRVAGRALLQLLALSEGNFGRADLFAWLAGAPFLDQGRLVPVAVWERLSREAGVVSGREQWDSLCERLSKEYEARAVEAEQDPGAPDWRAQSYRKAARQARGLRSFVLGLIDELKGSTPPRKWSEHASWARQLLRSLLGTAHLAGSGRWPPAEAKAAQKVGSALDRLATLDAVEGAVGLDTFARTLAVELEGDLSRVGRFGEGVLVGSVRMGVGLDLDLVVVLGLAEGSFPAPVGEDSLLSDRDRAATGGELPLPSERVQSEHRELLAALAGADRQLLCVPRGDMRHGGDRVPSRWVLAIDSETDGGNRRAGQPSNSGHRWWREVASFDAGLRGMSFPATAQEHRLASMLASPVGPPVLADPILEVAVEVLGARRSNCFTRFDGNLSGLAIGSPTSQVVSATRLESWAECPFAYFVGQILAVKVVENPEEQLEITPLHRGSLVHLVLERFIAEVLARPPADQPRPDQAWSKADGERLAVIAGELSSEYESQGLTGRPVFWRRDQRRILADLERFLVADSDRRRSQGTRPLAAEMAFGIPGAVLGSVSLGLSDGRALRFRGIADRVDRAGDGTLHVMDYKTGGSDRFRGLCEADPDLGGRKLQLAVYGAAVRHYYGVPDSAVRSEYWFVSAKGGFEQVGYLVTPAVMAHVGETLAIVVKGIEAGVFPSHPSASGTAPGRVECPFCDPDALGVSELRRSWEHKRSDPAFALFAELAEPLAAGGSDSEGVGDA